MKEETQNVRLAVDLISKYKDDKYVIVDRAVEPYGLALPGGFVESGETLDQAIQRELKLKTNLNVKDLNLFKPFSEPYRDPRGIVVTQVFSGYAYGQMRHGEKVLNIHAFTLDEIERHRDDFAFDHYAIIQDYVSKNRLPKVSAYNPQPVSQKNLMLWQVHYMGREWDNGSYGGDAFAGWEPVDKRYFVIANTMDEALEKAQTEHPKLKKKLKDDEEIVVSPIPLEALIAARDSRKDGRMGWISTNNLSSVELSLKADKKDYRIAVCILPK